MSKEIELVPGGGRYYRAMTFHWVVVAVLIVPVTATPVVETTTTLLVLAIPTVTLPPELTTRTLLVPLWMLVASMPVS